MKILEFVPRACLSGARHRNLIFGA